MKKKEKPYCFEEVIMVPRQQFHGETKWKIMQVLLGKPLLIRVC